MSVTNPVVPLEDIFRDSRQSQPSDKYPTKSIQQHANKLAQPIYQKYQELRSIVFPNLDDLIGRWREMSRKKRDEVLMQAWPGILPWHRPEVYNPEADKDFREHLPWDTHLLPFINGEDLVKQDWLLMLIDARSRYPPHHFASTELQYIPLGKIESPAEGSHRAKLLLRMQLDDPQRYGKITVLRSQEEALNFDCEGKGLLPIAGLQVLYMQDRLFDFLLYVVEILLEDKMSGIDYDCDLVEPAHSNGLSPEDLTINCFDMAAKEPLRPRREPHLDRLLRQVSAEARRARDHLWDIREDPREFEKFYHTTADHDESQIPDSSGRAQTVIGSSEFASFVLHKMVAKSHYTLILWDQLEVQLMKIKKLFLSNPTGVDVQTMEPAELVEEIRCFHLILQNLAPMVVKELGCFRISPDLRTQFKRTITSAIVQVDNYKQDTTKALLCDWLLKACGPDLDSDSTNFYDFVDARYSLDVLETFLVRPRYSKARDYITTPVNEAINRLWILTECHREFDKQPWYFKVWQSMPKGDKGMNLVEKVSKSTSAWVNIFQKAKGNDFITLPELGMPGTQFYYDTDASERKKRNVDRLCKAEANLDTFWKHVDDSLNRYVDNYQKGVLQRILDGDEKMHRTIPWKDRIRKDENSVPFREVFDFKPQPLSTVFHDSSKEITGNFDKSSIKEKTKKKTTGIPGPSGEEVEPARETTPEPRPDFPVAAKTWEVLKALFHMPGDKAQPSSMRWPAVVSALVELGFSAEQMHGSQWQFEPSPHLNLTRGISLHAPHTGGDEVSVELARFYGRRLNRAYGWEGEMFRIE